MSGPPRQEPIGRLLAATAKSVSRAFDEELAAAGGSQPVWLILLALKQRERRTQQDLAAAVGIVGPTLTHHLERLERDGLIARERDSGDRRVVRVELTAAGDELFTRLRRAAMSFDRRLRDGLSEDELTHLRAGLERLRSNVT
ncbi:MAG TPA: MarR family transcriptional regulator [Solirubrobacteraceae bacterium]|jgi:MarR family transcriptional regulator for hemolysin